MRAKRSENQRIASRSPLNGSLSWVIVSDQQTNSHSYVSALAPFSSGAVPQRPLKAKELTGQGFKPVSKPQHTRHYHTSRVAPLSKGRFIYVGSTSVVFLYLFPPPPSLPPLWLERRVTAKNSHQLACHFPVVLCLTRGFGETPARLLVSVVKTPFQFIFWEIQQISFQSGILVCSPG